MRTKWITLLAIGALSTMAALAADQTAAPPGGGAPGGPRGAGGMGGPGGFQGRGGMMGLDETQRQAFKDTLQKDNDKVRDLNEKLRAAQKELMQAVLAETYDEKVVRAKAEAVAAIQVDITLFRGKALATVAPSLKAEQKQQLIESPIGAMLLNSGGGGGRPGFQGMGPGGPGGGGFQGGGPGGPPAGGQNRQPRER
jgi:Spy/CpxP family protein refolding chaperone